MAAALGGNAVQFTTDGVTVADIPETGWDIDFNPAVDRLRVVSQTGLNFRMNPNTGAGVDGNTGVSGTNMDGAISGASGQIRGVAYTNNETQNGSGIPVATMLYTFDSFRFYIENPPNAGTQALDIQDRFNVTDVRGFDIAPGLNVDIGVHGKLKCVLRVLMQNSRVRCHPVLARKSTCP